MIVNLIKKQMFSSKLPTKVNGQYWIRDIDEMGRKKNLIEIEAQGGAWVLKSNKQIAIIGESNERLESRRSAKKQIIHQNKYISPHHAKIIYQNETWRMEDEGSTNGTY